FGQTRTGLPISAFKFGSSGPKVLTLAGVHGDEWEGVVAAQGLLKRFADSFTYKIQLTLVPMFNLNGILKKERKNASGVDLNRNLPTNDWSAEVTNERYFPGTTPNSEPENQALVAWLETNKPQFVLSLHSYKPMININGNCRPEAEVLQRLTGYEV